MNINIICLVVLLLSGCTVAKEQFDCQYQPGIGCKSITQVNNMVNNGLLGSEDDSTPNNVPQANKQYLRVWLAPYQADGYVYEGAILHTIF